jgi:hypothetical protein
MLLNNYFKNKMPLLAALGLLFGLTSCGSYQYVGQDSDGIYEPSNRRVEYREVPVRVADAEVQNNNSYYKNYFKEKSLEYENESLENEIFTDIDSYEGNYTSENDSLEIAYERYGGWGQNSSEISINIYPNYGFNNYWWYRPYYSWGWGGYYGNWGYGFNSFYPSFYGGFYGGYYGSFYNPYYYRNYRYSPYYNNRYYGNRYYSGRGYAYNTGRRGSTYTNRNSNFIRRNSLSSRTRNYSTTRPNVRTNTTRRSNTVNANRNNTTRARVNNNSTRTRVNANTTRRRNSSAGSSAVSKQRRSYNNSSSTPSRSRSSGNVSRSSTRSSGSSTRSSSSSRPSSRRR